LQVDFATEAGALASDSTTMPSVGYAERKVATALSVQAKKGTKGRPVLRLRIAGKPLVEGEWLTTLMAMDFPLLTVTVSP
jgi:hypothetical protein